MPYSKPFTCFFIAQMTTDADMARMNRIINELLHPLLTPLGYGIITPDDPSGSADVFKFVMKMLDTADLLIADLTDDNPNVYYELSIRHSLGLPYVLLSQDKIRFDITTLRYIKYQPNQLDNPEMIHLLTTAIQERHKEILSKGDIDNPITNFYGVPLAEVSPASGLGLGYYRNFVRTTMRDIRDERNEIYVENTRLSATEQQTVKLQIWIPNQLEGAFHQNIKDLLLAPRTLVPAEIRKPNISRPFPLYALPDRSQGVILVDIPTAMNAMEVAIAGRYSLIRLDKTSVEWEKLQAEEIDRFTDTLKRHLNNEEELLVKRNVSLVPWDVATS